MNIVNVQFIKGINETVIPEIRLTRSRTGSTGTATFRFKNPSILRIDISNKQLISGLYLIDQEGTLLTKTLDVKFLLFKKSLKILWIQYRSTNLNWI